MKTGYTVFLKSNEVARWHVRPPFSVNRKTLIFAQAHLSILPMLRILLAISVLAMSCLSKTSLELCAHAGGDVHVFLLGDTCAGQHAGHDSKEHGHGADSGSGQEHPHPHHHPNEGEAEHHEPCDHEFLDFEGEWLARAGQSTAIEYPQAEILPAAEKPHWAVPQWAKRTTEYPPRAPPWRHESSDHFLATVRLLI